MSLPCNLLLCFELLFWLFWFWFWDAQTESLLQINFINHVLLGKNWNTGGYLRIKLLFETGCWIFMCVLSFSPLVKYWWPPACYSWKSPARYLTLLKSQEQSNCDINILISISISLWGEPVGAFKGISSKLNEVLL